MLCFFGVFYCQDSIKSSLKSSTILHFRNLKLKNFSYKASHLQSSIRASKLQFQPPQPKRASYGPADDFTNAFPVFNVNSANVRATFAF